MMNANLINPFLEAMNNVLPSLGFKEITKESLNLGEGFLLSKGVTVLIGLTHDVQGNIAYNMTEDVAKKIASTMMMGMPVQQMDELAQSAISELVNMITGNAASNFEKQGMRTDISPPSLIIGKDFKVKVSSNKFLILHLLIDGHLLEINMGLENK